MAPTARVLQGPVPGHRVRRVTVRWPSLGPRKHWVNALQDGDSHSSGTCSSCDNGAFYSYYEESRTPSFVLLPVSAPRVQLISNVLSVGRPDYCPASSLIGHPPSHQTCSIRFSKGSFLAIELVTTLRPECGNPGDAILPPVTTVIAKRSNVAEVSNSRSFCSSHRQARHAESRLVLIQNNHASDARSDRKIVFIRNKTPLSQFQRVICSV